MTLIIINPLHSRVAHRSFDLDWKKPESSIEKGNSIILLIIEFSNPKHSLCTLIRQSRQYLKVISTVKILLICLSCKTSNEKCIGAS